ncbi:hypothetical protein GGR57DRAFT_271899 [Xylariaceae sp. FL1272]|nr:hypothetical protein GGR57DRAFT_271899 [Xylariaceae sp. FL1272]
MPQDTTHVEAKKSLIDGAGRGLFALKDFAPGDIVLSLDRPLVAELDNDRIRDTCGWCLQRAPADSIEQQRASAMGFPNVEVKSCTGCRKVCYCSRSCQSKAWKREHKYECKVLAAEQNHDLPEEVRGVLKLLGRLESDPTARESILDVLKFTPFGIEGGLDALKKHNPQQFEGLQMLGNAAWRLSDRRKPETENLARGLVLNVNSNANILGSPFDKTLSIHAFDPTMCSANHSCDPNAASVFNQPAVLLRALKPVKRGEEITMSYRRDNDPFSLRRADLKRDWRFDCHCTKCRKGPVTPDDVYAIGAENLSGDYFKLADGLIKRHAKDLPNHLPPGSNSLAHRRLAAMEAWAYQIASKQDATMTEIQGALSMCINSGMWTWARQPVPRLAGQLLSKCLESGDVHRAFLVACKTHFAVQALGSTPPFHPTRVIDAWDLSTMTNVLCGPQFDEVEKQLKKVGIDLRAVYFGFLFEAYDNVPKSYGYDSSFGKVVQKTYQELMDNIGLDDTEIRKRVKQSWPALETLVKEVDVLSES